MIGGKGTAVNVAEQIEHARLRFGASVRCLGFAIDDPSLGHSIAGLPIVSGVKSAWTQFRDSDVLFLFALYRPDVMAARYELLAGLGIPPARFAVFVHPSAYVSASATLGPGSVVMSHTTVQQGVTIGRHCIVNSNVVIEHEAEVADGAFIAAGACLGARARIGESCFVGLKAAIREDVSIGRAAFVGMSATVVRDVETGTLVYGSPARTRK